jgi:phosphate transport system protein
MGNDLRAALSYLKSGTDLERCGDEADKIARIAKRIARGDIPPVGGLAEVVEDMGTLAVRLLTDTLNALHDSNMKLALTVAEGDAALDDQYRAALRVFHEHLDDDEETRQVVTELVLVVKALERVGDHAKNIARYVIFAVIGRDVRHVSAQVLRDELHERSGGPGEG